MCDYVESVISLITVSFFDIAGYAYFGKANSAAADTVTILCKWIIWPFQDVHE